MTQAELRLVKELVDTIAALCDEFIKNPTKIKPYRDATQLLKEQENAKISDA